VIQDARFALDCALHEGEFVYCPGTMAFYRDHKGASLSKRDRMAFNRDCLTNVLEVKTWWEQRGSLSGRRREMVAALLHYVAHTTCGNDASTYQRACAAMMEFCPHFRLPSGSSFQKAAFRLLPYRHAVGWLHLCSSFWRFLRSAFPAFLR
jgi:hypothetical protein